MLFTRDPGSVFQWWFCTVSVKDKGLKHCVGRNYSNSTLKLIDQVFAFLKRLAAFSFKTLMASIIMESAFSGDVSLGSYPVYLCNNFRFKFATVLLVWIYPLHGEIFCTSQMLRRCPNLISHSNKLLRIFNKFQCILFVWPPEGPPIIQFVTTR